MHSPEEARKYAEDMIGQHLVTKQTGEAGRICNAVMLAERRPPKHEYYLAFLMDRASSGPVVVASARGGMNIEDVAKEDPDAIITEPIDYKNGLQEDACVRPSISGGEQADDAQGTRHCSQAQYQGRASYR